MPDSVIGYAAPHLNVQASSTIKAACGTAAFRTRDDPKHDVKRLLPHVLVPAGAVSVQEGEQGCWND